MGITLNTDRLRACRERMGISKLEAAKRMQLSQPAYLRYEAGTRTPSLQTLAVIANVLNTSSEYLTDRSDDPLPVTYTVNKEDDPQLFEVIRLCKTADKKLIDRIIAYASRLSDSD